MADEPTGNLDSKNSAAIIELIEELHVYDCALNKKIEPYQLEDAKNAGITGDSAGLSFETECAPVFYYIKFQKYIKYYKVTHERIPITSKKDGVIIGSDATVRFKKVE